ncbi:MAG: hypothetical protein M3P22_00395 [bacterium]|nr:hypothetical protein [bacterium]
MEGIVLKKPENLSEFLADISKSELDKALREIGYNLEPSGSIVTKSFASGVICAFYIRPRVGTWTYLTERILFTKANLNTFESAFNLLKERLIKNESHIFTSYGFQKELNFEFRDGKLIANIKDWQK